MALVMLESGKLTRMDELEKGHRVQTGMTMLHNGHLFIFLSETSIVTEIQIFNRRLVGALLFVD